MSELNDVAGGETITATRDNQIKERSVMRYASAAARDTSIPAPVAGSLAYLQDSNTVTYYDGSGWVTVFTESGGALTGDLLLDGNDILGVRTLEITAPATDSIELGRIDGVASTPFIDFHAGAVAVDRDIRIIAIDGTGSNDGGTLTFQGLIFKFNGVTEFNQGSTAIGYSTGIGVNNGQHRNITISTSAPSGGKDGDVWMQYTP